MTSTCTRPFDEELLTGYLDRALPQGQTQRVRIHLEDCSECRTLYEEMALLRETARTTRFEVPDDSEWPEAPRTPVGRWSRSAGWVLVIAWLIVSGAVALWRFFQYAADPLEVFLVLGLPGGFVLLFVSVLLDRLRDLETDRYRGVHR